MQRQTGMQRNQGKRTEVRIGSRNCFIFCITLILKHTPSHNKFSPQPYPYSFLSFCFLMTVAGAQHFKYKIQATIMNNSVNDSQSEQNIDLSDSAGMNPDQREMFLSISRSRSADSFIGKFLPHPNEVPDRDRRLVWEPMHSIAPTIIVPRPSGEGQKQGEGEKGGLRVFKKIKKEKVKSKCDYDKNICGYITKKVIRQFLGKNYEQEVLDLTRRYRCSFNECKTYFLRKVELVTGPSHLPELFTALPDEPLSLRNCKRAFRDFYRWFLKQRYLRYLLLEGKMTNKMAYIQYKNTHLFKFVDFQQDDEVQEEIREFQMSMRTRSKSGIKGEEQDLI